MKEKNQQVDLTEQSSEVMKYVKGTYENEIMANFVRNVSDVLRIVFKTNIEMGEGVSNLIFCVFSSFYPELFDAIKVEDLKLKEDKLKADKNGTKYQIKMAPLTQLSVKSKEKFTLFKNAEYFTNRIEELNIFCLTNKRIINKLIK